MASRADALFAYLQATQTAGVEPAPVSPALRQLALQLQTRTKQLRKMLQTDLNVGFCICAASLTFGRDAANISE